MPAAIEGCIGGWSVTCRMTFMQAAGYERHFSRPPSVYRYVCYPLKCCLVVLSVLAIIQNLRVKVILRESKKRADGESSSHNR